MIKARKTVENLPAKKVDTYRKEWRLKLDLNENIYGVSNHVISAMKNFDFEDIYLYPVYGKLIDKIASFYNINAQQIMLTNGYDDALNILINAYIDDEDIILTYDSSMLSSLYMHIRNIKIKRIDYVEKYKCDIKSIEKEITANTKMLYISTPNNITGEILRAAELEILIRQFQNILFVIDCSYINYADNITFEDYIDMARKYENVAIIKSFSIDYALAGIRLGFIYTSENIINNLNKITPLYNVSAIALNCGCAALNDKKYLEQIKSINSNARQLLSEGVSEKGFVPYHSEANFVLCDFYDCVDFYYEKLKKNGVIVKKFEKNSQFSTCLNITLPKIGGVKYILELLNKKDILIFDIDNVILDFQDSYTSVILKTFEHFANHTIDPKEIKEALSSGKYRNNYRIVRSLLEQNFFYVELDDIERVFWNLYYNPAIEKQEFLIDEVRLLISKEVLEKLSQEYDLVALSSKSKMELDYLLNKFEIDKYFYFSTTKEYLENNGLELNSELISDIVKHCPNKSIKLLGGNAEDIIAGNGANIETIGVIGSGADHNEMVNNYKHLCANYIMENINDIIGFLEKNEQNLNNFV